MQRSTRVVFTLLCGALGAAPAGAADLEAGKARALSVCAACPGATGMSVSDTIPNLAGQRAAYLESQLKAWKDGSRRNPIMNAIAGQLGADDIANVAAYFASLPGATTGMKSDLLPQLARTRVAFPAGYASSFTKYHTINFPATRQVRVYFANDVALRAARAAAPLPDGSVLFAEVHSAKVDADNKPIVGGDGLFQPDKLLFYTAMAREAGWGSDFPDLLRNEDWNYAVFTSAGQMRLGVNQAECLACHKPHDRTSYTFTLEQLGKVARSR